MSYNTMPVQSTGDVWTAAANNTYVRDNFIAGVPHIFSAKGYIAIATGANAASGLSVGENETVLIRDDGESSGVKWGKGAVPIGGILIWSGSTGSIPSGWQICDGTNGTPNLRDRFVVGSGDSYSSGNTGGAATKDLTHSHTSGGNTSTENDHSHTLAGSGSTLTGGAHAHTHPTNTGTYYGGTLYQLKSGSQDTTAVNHAHTTPAEPAADATHTHSITGPGNAGEHNHSVNNPTGDGLTASESILPPYYALAYIMRLS